MSSAGAWPMPSLFEFGSYTVFFWVSDGAEPMHVHASLGRPSPNSLKFWVSRDGKAVLARRASGFRTKDIRRLEKAIENNFDVIVAAWIESFGQEPNYYEG